MLKCFHKWKHVIFHVLILTQFSSDPRRDKVPPKLWGRPSRTVGKTELGDATREKICQNWFVLSWGSLSLSLFRRRYFSAVATKWETCNCSPFPWCFVGKRYGPHIQTKCPRRHTHVHGTHLHESFSLSSSHWVTFLHSPFSGLLFLPSLPLSMFTLLPFPTSLGALYSVHMCNGRMGRTGDVIALC